MPNGLNIDFIGGTAYGGKLTKGRQVAEMRKLVDDEGPEGDSQPASRWRKCRTSEARRYD